MAIKSGRVGVRHDQVDHYGRIKNVAGGIYSNLSAGSLVSSASAENSKLNTHSSFTGKIDLTSIKGNTIKWNQLIENGNFENVSAWLNTNTAYTVSNGTAIIKAINTSGQFGIYQSFKRKALHKYYISFEMHSFGTIRVRRNRFSGDGQDIVTEGVYQKIETSQSETTLTSPYQICFAEPVSDIDADYFTLKNYMIIDLTDMFGAGNEPTTVEQVKSMFPLDWYEYDTGSLLSFKADVLLNTLTGEQIYLPTLTYFPTGMKSAGRVYDELTPSKATTRIGAVDLGTLNWSYISSGSERRFVATISDAKSNTSSTNLGNIVCTRYENATWQSILTQAKDKIISLYYTSNNNYLGVIDDDYSDATAFKSAMSGVMLYYELATPVETDIDVDFNLSLNVNEGENLQLLPLGTDTPASAPLRASVTSYKSGATGNDVEKLLGSIAQVESSPATTNHAEGDYIMYNYQLYKVTASITTGASLVVGTNITATTVMDEFKTL